MNILWIVQKNLQRDLDISTWLETATFLAKRNHHVTLVALSSTREKFASSIPNLVVREIRVVNLFPFVSISFHLQVLIFSLIWIFSLRPNVIMTHPLTALFLLPAKFAVKLSGLKTKFVLDIRTLPVRSANLNDKIKKKLIDLTIKIAKAKFEKITVITPVLQKIISERYQIDLRQISVWMSGVNIDLFQPKDRVPMFHQQSDDSFIVMYHGALAENRGLFETMQAMAYVKEKFPNIKLLILGKGLAYEMLVQKANNQNLTDVIRFHEAISYNQMPDYIAQADVGIIPLPDEECWRVSSPLKLFEYLAMAKPVIVSPIEAHTSVMNDCPAAIWLKSTSPPDIAEGIMTAYSLRDQFHQLGKKGREFVVHRFSWEHQALRLEEFLKKL